MTNVLKKGKDCIGQQVCDSEGNKGLIIDFFVENGKKSKVVIQYEDGTSHTREKYAVQRGTFKKPYLDDIDKCLEQGWKYIEGFNHQYIISKEGQIKSAFGVNKGRLLSPAIDNNGYQIIVLQTGTGKSTRKLCRIHSLMANTFIRIPAKEEEVNHIDGNKLNNTLANLEIISRKSNNKKYIDFLELGLTEKELQEIQNLCLKNNITIKEYILKKIKE